MNDKSTYPYHVTVQPQQEFEDGINGYANVNMGQAYVEQSECLPAGANDSDYYAKVTIEVTSEEHVKNVIMNFKGLLAMLTMIPEFQEHYNKGFKFTVKASEKSEKHVDVIFNLSHDFILAILQTDLPDIVPIFAPYGSKLAGQIKLGFNPLHLLTKDVHTIINSAFDIFVSVHGDGLLKTGAMMAEKNLRYQADSKKDIIADRLAFPICDIIKKCVDEEKTEYDNTYDREYLKKAIIDYNLSFSSSFEREAEELQRFQVQVKDFYENQLKSLATGFFGAYLKVLDTIHFDNLSLFVASKKQAIVGNVSVNIPGASTYIRENIIVLLKK
jgi:hypothetical protein